MTSRVKLKLPGAGVVPVDVGATGGVIARHHAVEVAVAVEIAERNRRVPGERGRSRRHARAPLEAGVAALR